MEVKTKSPKETKQIAQKIGANLKGGETLALYGDLGAGKTVFIQGLAQALGIKKKITSPTFVFMKTYVIKKNRRDLNFYHLDLYKIQGPADLFGLGLEEIFGQDSIVVIEWADKAKDQLPQNAIEVFIEKTDEKTRRIKIKGN